MEDVALRIEDGWMLRFAVMLALSIIVAVMGLSAGSTAIVIGAMLLAPLITPVMGSAAALAMALPRHLSRSLLVVIAATAVSVLLAFTLAAVLQDPALSTEVLARTSPDLRDLIVALAAGAAGAYATVRPDVSAALPGVAIAVALVPPLATIGITLQAGRGDLVGGAVLLYAANLLAIILMATVVFLVTGFVPRGRLEAKGAHVIGGGIVLTAATAAVAVPLALASIAAAEAGSERADLHDAAAGWLRSTGDDLDEVRASGGVVRVRISGPNPPPDTTDLERAIDRILGPSATLQIRWTQTQDAVDEDAAAEQPPDSPDETDGAIRAIIDEWLVSGGAHAYEITRLDIGDSEIRIDLVSAEPPPSVDDLSAQLVEDLQLSTPVVVNWTQRTMLRSGDTTGGEVDSLATTEREIRLAAQRWARSHSGLVVDHVTYDGERVTVELLGPQSIDVSGLETDIREIVGDDTAVDIWLTRREMLSAGSGVPDGTDD